MTLDREALIVDAALAIDKSMGVRYGDDAPEELRPEAEAAVDAVLAALGARPEQREALDEETRTAGDLTVRDLGENIVVIAGTAQHRYEGVLMALSVYESGVSVQIKSRGFKFNTLDVALDHPVETARRASPVQPVTDDKRMTAIRSCTSGPLEGA